MTQAERLLSTPTEAFVQSVFNTISFVITLNFYYYYTDSWTMDIYDMSRMIILYDYEYIKNVLIIQ